MSILDNWIQYDRLGSNSPYAKNLDEIEDDDGFLDGEDDDDYEDCPGCGAGFDEECDPDCDYRSERAQ